MQELKQGTKLQDGRYIIKRVLGQGGFGITYLAEQVSLGRDVAIKEFFMKENCVRDGASGEVTTVHSAQAERYHDKFLKEARTLSDLRHQNIIKIIDVFKEKGEFYRKIYSPLNIETVELGSYHSLLFIYLYGLTIKVKKDLFKAE